MPIQQDTMGQSRANAGPPMHRGDASESTLPQKHIFRSWISRQSIMWNISEIKTHSSSLMTALDDEEPPHVRR
jgi:hypothetical protein